MYFACIYNVFYYLYRQITTTKLPTMETMRTFKKVKIDTKEMRAALKSAGIKTVQMRTNKEGLLICIADIEGNEAKFVSFCKENGLKKGAMNDKLFSVGGIKGDFIDYGRLYKYEEVL